MGGLGGQHMKPRLGAASTSGDLGITGWGDLGVRRSGDPDLWELRDHDRMVEREYPSVNW